MPESPSEIGQPQEPSGEPHPMWRDSSLELERGLEVTELHVEVSLPLESVPPEKGKQQMR